MSAPRPTGARPPPLRRRSQACPSPSPAPPREPQPIALPALQRTGTAAGKPGAAAPAPQLAPGPDPALLERVAEILRQIQLHAGPGVKRLTLDLQPAELGHLAIQLALRGGKVHAIVRAEKAETLELLAQHEPALTQALAERGIPTDAVRFELGFGGKGAQARHGAPSPSSTRSSPARGNDLAPPRSSTSLVDTLA